MHKPDFTLTDKIAVVTGASRGLGNAVAFGLAMQGANLVIVSRNQADCESVAKEIRALGKDALPVATDISKLDSIHELVDKTITYYGKVDVLVNNAGVAVTVPAEKLSEADWDLVIDTNLKGVFFTSQKFGQEMIKQERGKIINMASVFGIVGSKSILPYCASKGGLIQITKVLALEWAKYNIQVNAIAPSYIQTDMNKEILENELIYKKLLSKVPAGRLGQAEEIAAATVFLASEAANYITGHTLVVDGGWTA